MSRRLSRLAPIVIMIGSLALPLGLLWLASSQTARQAVLAWMTDHFVLALAAITTVNALALLVAARLGRRRPNRSSEPAPRRRKSSPP